MLGRSIVRGSLGGAVALVAAGALLVPADARAQQRDADFLFKTPRVTLGIHGGYAIASAGSDVFDWYEDLLTLDRSDFSSVLVGGELAVRVTERVDIALGVSRAKSEATSEYRDLVGTDDLPILQTTEFTRVPITVGAKVYLRDRGRSIGRFAWIPEEWAPYLGGGLGVTHYRFRQEGEWVDEETFDIFYDVLESEGTATTGFVRAGTDVSLGPRFFFTLDGRYTWASTPLDADTFVGFDDIDLGGFDLTFGFAVRL